MDTIQLEQLVMIHQEKTLTRPAEKLYLSQPALTQGLNRLEKELGFPIFYREEGNFHPTTEGAVYLEIAEKMIQIKAKTYKKIADLNKKNHKSLIHRREPSDRIYFYFQTAAPVSQRIPTCHAGYRRGRFQRSETPAHKRRS